jgi:hypothetical protein
VDEVEVEEEVEEEEEVEDKVVKEREVDDENPQLIGDPRWISAKHHNGMPLNSAGPSWAPFYWDIKEGDSTVLERIRALTRLPHVLEARGQPPNPHLHAHPHAPSPLLAASISILQSSIKRSFF